jgi:hypothetical protein
MLKAYQGLYWPMEGMFNDGSLNLMPIHQCYEVCRVGKKHKRFLLKVLVAKTKEWESKQTGKAIVQLGTRQLQL